MQERMYAAQVLVLVLFKNVLLEPNLWLISHSYFLKNFRNCVCYNFRFIVL